MNLNPIIEFIDSGKRNAWLQVDMLDVYVRDGYHNIDGQAHRTFDVASVELAEELRGQGMFTEFMLALRRTVASRGFKVIYVENILNTKLIAFLEGIGYAYVPRSNPPSFYLFTE